ncbi:MAG: hypothetical protein HZA83_00690 [Thaumarchaeota archaeon]|nr:hypothetical protein [Nitrososphaerota archaeon]
MKGIVCLTKPKLTSANDMSPIRGTQQLFFDALLSDRRLAVVTQHAGDLDSFLRDGKLGSGIDLSSAAKKALEKAHVLAGRNPIEAVLAGGICGLVENFGKKTAKPGEGIIVTSKSHGTHVSYTYTMGTYDNENNARLAEVLDINGTSIAKQSESCRAAPILRVSALVSSVSALGPKPSAYRLKSGADSLDESISNLLKDEGNRDQSWFYVGFGVCTVEARVWTRLFSGPRFLESVQLLPPIKGPSMFVGYLDPRNDYEKDGHTHIA